MKAEKIKKYVNKKLLLGVTSLFICVLTIAVSSFVPFIIDPTQWQTTKFLTNELIICAIVIFSMVAALFIGQTGNAENDKSRIAKARVSFFETIGKISDINGFSQWVRKVMQPEDIKIMQEREMRSIGIEDFSILKLEHNEIKALLETPQKYNGRFYKGLSKEQIKALLKLKNGENKIKLVAPEYYLSVKNILVNKTITERSSSESYKKGLFLFQSIMSRLVITVVTAMIFASLARDLATNTNVAESLYTFASRMWAMISSVFMGYLLGCQMNDIDAEYIEMRVMVHRKYLQDKTFVPKTQQELAKEEFVERVKKEEQKLLENNSRLLDYKK